ncbi:MAG: hypothetical protein HYS67_00870 [Deltaproteobacteria bacterium]|nr:hypothetical protein [Deltaproteobacteria bacterium]MBI3061492.1 hypothetical protein [Deltaproteobacteria bacterium]
MPSLDRAKASNKGDQEPKKEPPRQQLVSTKNIVERNLFDPERGVGRAREADASSAATQRVRSMILLGTAILGTSRYAILQQPSDSRSPAPGAPSAQQVQLRLKVGDTVEGFKLSEIHEKKVIFTKGASKVEVALDFFRKTEPTKAVPAPPARPGIAPNVPRRGSLPPPPAAR